MADQSSDAVDVEALERADLEDTGLEIAAEERRLHVVAREAPRHLGQVVGAEGEELRRLRDLVSGHGRTRELDHGSDLVRDRRAAFLLDRGGHLGDPTTYQVELG